jgi:chemotaxis protein MotB
MRNVKLSAILLLSASVIFFSGCTQELEQLRLQNDRQSRRINELNAELEKAKLERDQYKQQLEELQAKGGVDADSLRKQVAALQDAIKEKDAMIKELSERLKNGGTILPPELSTLLEDLAKANPGLITYDPQRGVVKFNSDLLFDKGSDTVATSAVSAINTLCGILNGEQGKNFDVIVAGHTDDIPIQRAETLALHKNNWYLSVHRAISVEAVMEKANISPKRLSVRGFGEYRPIAENAAGKKGNEKNRRVEIYIVQQGA